MKTIQIQLSITLDETAAKSLAELLVPAIKQTVAFSASEFDEKRNPRLQSSRNAIFSGEQPPSDQGLLIDSRETAKLMKISQRTLFRMHTNGEMPPPIRIGRAVRWSLEVLKKWVDEGCPVDLKWRTKGT